MDDRRFDSLTRLLASGASRRTLIRSLLGLGGAAVLANDADARTIGTRPTIPPPKPPACALPKQMCGGVCCEAGKCKNGHCCDNTTDVWCAGDCCVSGLCTGDGQTCCSADQKVCGDVCCNSATSCAIDGNQDICCDPATHYPCGLECCDENDYQCCDRECCAAGHVCLVRAFGGEIGSIEEEVCCPVELTCDDRCCGGECFNPAGEPLFVNAFDVDPAIFDRECCEAPNEVCQGLFSALCCGESETCCVREGTPICIPAGGCCTVEQCPGDCAYCDVGLNECGSLDQLCSGCERCDDGQCVDDDTRCLACEDCVDGQCQPLGDETGGPPCDFDGSAGVCCHGSCIDAEDRCGICPPGTKLCPDDRCIFNNECCADCSELNIPDECIAGHCTSTGECGTSDCGPSLICCERGCEECCGDDVSNCIQEFGFHEDCVFCQSDIGCESLTGAQCGDGGICTPEGQCGGN